MAILEYNWQSDSFLSLHHSIVGDYRCAETNYFLPKLHTSPHQRTRPRSTILYWASYCRFQSISPHLLQEFLQNYDSMANEWKNKQTTILSYNPSGELLSQEITSAFNLIPRNEQCHCCYPAMIKSCTDVTSGNGSRYSSSCSAQPIHKSSVRLLLYQIKSMWIIRMSINDELCVRRRLFKPTIRRNQNHQHDEDGHSFTAQTTILLLAHLRNRKPTKHLNFVFN